MALRRDFSGLRGGPLDEADLGALISDDELDKADLLNDGLGVEGVRSLVGCLDGDGVLEGSGDLGKLCCLVFGVGKGGNDPVGGLVPGWEG